MTAAKYRAERKVRGTQADVAAALDVARSTVERRESGKMPITREAWIALLALPKKRARARRPNAANTQPIERP